MKRIFISIILLAITFGASLAEILYVGIKSDTYVSEIEKIDRLMLKTDFEAAKELCDKTEEKWSETEKNIDTLLIHDYVDNVTLNLAKMKAHIENCNPDMYFAESMCAKKALASIKGSEYPDIDNIL